MENRNIPIQMGVHAKRDGTCDIRISDKRFSATLHGKMVYHIYRHVCFVTTRKSFDANAVAVMMILMEDEIWEKLKLEVQIEITADDLDIGEIKNYYEQFQIGECRAA